MLETVLAVDSRSRPLGDGFRTVTILCLPLVTSKRTSLLSRGRRTSDVALAPTLKPKNNCLWTSHLRSRFDGGYGIVLCSIAFGGRRWDCCRVTRRRNRFAA